MEFYHSLGNMKAAKLDNKITSPKTFVLVMIKLLELINTWGQSEDQSLIRLPYLYIDTTKLKRAFIVKSNQIVSFAFPFSIYTKADALGNERLHIKYWDMELDDTIISYATSIAETLDLVKSTYAAQAKMLDFSDSNNVVAAKVFEVALALEPSYVRYDYDPKACDGTIHPLHHFDFNYNGDYTYKIGLYGDLSFDDVTEIISDEEGCWYVHSYSSMLRRGIATQEWLRRLIDNQWWHPFKTDAVLRLRKQGPRKRRQWILGTYLTAREKRE